MFTEDLWALMWWSSLNEPVVILILSLISHVWSYDLLLLALPQLQYSFIECILDSQLGTVTCKQFTVNI